MLAIATAIAISAPLASALEVDSDSGSPDQVLLCLREYAAWILGHVWEQERVDVEWARIHASQDGSPLPDGTLRADYLLDEMCPPDDTPLIVSRP